MSSVPSSPAELVHEHEDHAFYHEAFFYGSDAEFVEASMPFLEEGLAAGEPMLVAVPGPRVELLRRALNGAADRVRFADMVELGHNPARIIPAWTDFVAEVEPGRPARGIGEPIWAGRGPAEMVECQRHESLLNLAFAGRRNFRLACPYDTRALDPAMIAEARRSHPYLREGDVTAPSEDYAAPPASAGFDADLPDPGGQPHRVAFAAGGLGPLRRLVSRFAGRAGLSARRTEDLVLAMSEIATNTLRHGGGIGTVAIWQDDGSLICEVRDRGRIEDPLAGRVRPGPEQLDGRGLWLANHLCDLVQIRSLRTGCVVRLHISAG